MLELSQLQISLSGGAVSRLTLEPGTITVALGRNHSGKSALCRLLVGLPSEATAILSLNGPSFNLVGADGKSGAFVGVDSKGITQAVRCCGRGSSSIDRLPRSTSSADAWVWICCNFMGTSGPRKLRPSPNAQ